MAWATITFLFVGTIEKRKNLGIVIDAFIQLKKVCSNEYKLVLAGAQDMDLMPMQRE